MLGAANARAKLFILTFRSCGSCRDLRRALGNHCRHLGMTREEEVLAALDKPRALFSIQQRVDPSNKSTDALQDLLMRMRQEGKVKFDIHTGKWNKI